MKAKKRRLNRISIVLIEKDKNNKWLADALGVSPSAVSKWTTNKGQPTVEMLFEIARVLDVPVPELLNLRE
jgi:transcriptional regulator with XRE-family HTH domain